MPAYVGIVEWWFINEMPYPPHVMEEQVANMLEMHLS
nr:TetR-like C-terminal domain-containing protein [Paenibacillus algorifonticola]